MWWCVGIEIKTILDIDGVDVFNIKYETMYNWDMIEKIKQEVKN